MTQNIEQQLIENISQLLKKSLTADQVLAELRKKKSANFSAIFPEGSGFKSSANTFQPYIEEIADQLLQWQQSKDQEILISLVKKIEKLFKVMTKFESHFGDTIKIL